jgi:hypothetical protein
MSAALLAEDIAAPLDHARRLADQFAVTAAELDSTAPVPFPPPTSPRCTKLASSIW